MSQNQPATLKAFNSTLTLKEMSKFLTTSFLGNNSWIFSFKKAVKISSYAVIQSMDFYFPLSAL
ncbi:MAG: hypothetical protein JWP69_1727 [Flaviaesturariibacter sp.]|nr:hypothetical protein [Flaviaesturariibacter sp.]